MNNYSRMIADAEKAGFEVYCDTSNENCRGTILTNTQLKSPYNGECIDIFEDGTFEQYCQLKGQTPTYKVQ